MYIRAQFVHLYNLRIHTRLLVVSRGIWENLEKEITFMYECYQKFNDFYEITYLPDCIHEQCLKFILLNCIAQ